MFEAVDRDAIRRQVERLLTVSVASPSLISVYANVGSGFAESRSISPRLHGILDQPRKVLDSGELDRAHSAAMREDIDKVSSLEGEIAKHRGRGVAVFESGPIDEDSRLLLNDTVWDVGVAGRRPYIRPMVAALEAFRNIATLVVESRAVDVSIDVLNSHPSHETIRGRYSRKSNRGGWFALEEQRNRRRADERRHKLFDAVERHLVEADRLPPLDAIYVVGQEKLTNEVVNRLRPTLAAKCDQVVADTHTATRATVLDTVRKAERDSLRMAAEELWTTVRFEATPQREGVVGLRAVAPAVNRGSVEELLINGTEPVSGWECPSCWAVHLDDGVCPACKEQLAATFDVLDSLTHGVLAAGGTVSQTARTIQDSDLRTVANLRY